MIKNNSQSPYFIGFPFPNENLLCLSASSTNCSVAIPSVCFGFEEYALLHFNYYLNLTSTEKLVKELKLEEVLIIKKKEVMSPYILGFY